MLKTEEFLLSTSKLIYLSFVDNRNMKLIRLLQSDYVGNMYRASINRYFILVTYMTAQCYQFKVMWLARNALIACLKHRPHMNYFTKTHQ